MPTAFITAPTDAGPALAKGLVENRLAACVNILDCISVYRWDGDILEDDEVILLAKTTGDRYADLVEYVTANHPYDVPCVERFDESDVLPPYEGWVSAETERT